MTKLSVIIPVYNTAKYLSKCLDSLFMQNFSDFEVICVDDGSIDNSLEVLARYKDVTVLKQNHKGSGVARNLGLQQAKGEYVLFVDSDDWLVDGAFEKLVHAVENLNSDILIFGGKIYSKGKLRRGSYSVNKIPKKYLNRIFNKNEFKNEIFKFPSTAWTKLYKRNFLIKNNIRFQEIFVGQDQLFFIDSMLKSERIAVLEEDLYCYWKRRPGSVTTNKKKNNFSPVYVFRAVEKVIRDYEYRDVILNRYFLKATFWLPKMREDLKGEYYKEYCGLLKYVKENYPHMWWSKLSVNYNESYLFLKIKCCLLRLQNKSRGLNK